MPEFLNTPEISVDAEDANNNKVFGILSYFGILALVGLLAAPNSRYAKYHANQGLVLCIFSVGAGIVIGILTTILAFIKLAWLGGILSSLVSLVVFAMAVFGIINAVQGKAKELPLIGQFHWFDKDIQ